MPDSYLAIDLGAGSGRSIQGHLEHGKLNLSEVNRFPNPMKEIDGHLHWDVDHLFGHIKTGIAGAAAAADIKSVAVDTWGVDFGLLDQAGSLLGNPFAYRDTRTQGALQEFLERVPRDRIYELTGIQFMEINTLFQLYAMVRDRSPLLSTANALLMMPDLMNYLLTGERKSEFTISTTSQMMNPRTHEWVPDLLDALQLPASLMSPVVKPGTVIGSLIQSVADETKSPTIPVIACGSHDTASAVAAVPAEGDDWCFISCGTWSLMGIETGEPIINDLARDLDFTNEGGVDGSVRFLKNINGLWPLQECKRVWDQERERGYDELTRLAQDAGPFHALINPADARFLQTSDMPCIIRDYCAEKGLKSPEQPGQTVRTILESLAMEYRYVLELLRRATGRPIRKIHMVGGGIQNRLLCQFAADATGLPVMAGPVEATAAGNILVQARTLGVLSSLSEIRTCVRDSFDIETFEPQDSSRWDGPYGRYLELKRN